MVLENEFNYYSEDIFTCDDFRVLGLIVNPEIKDNKTKLLVISITHYNYNKKDREYYGYCVFDAYLDEKIELTRENLLEKTKSIYLYTDKYTNDGCSISGEKNIVFNELLNDFGDKLDKKIIINIFNR